jgi:large subunit ribosomal protein L4
MAVKVKVYNQKLEVIEELSLSEKVFKVAPNADLIHQAVVAQRNNERQVLADTKDRSEVRGGGKKPWKQKGTGRARAGSSRSPIWIGGGVTFGPTSDRNFSQKINKKMKQKAIMMALSDRMTNNALVVFDELKATEYKTKTFAKFLTEIEKKVLATKRRSVLIINNLKDEKLKYSVRNLSSVGVINLENINILNLLQYNSLILTKDALLALEKIYK